MTASANIWEMLKTTTKTHLNPFRNILIFLFCNVALCEQVNVEKPRSMSMFSDGPVYLDRAGALIRLRALT